MKLSELFNPNEFAARHLSFGDEAALLEALGEKSMDDFVGNTVPQSIRMPSELDLPEALTEADALAKLKGIASKNVINKSYIGLGYYPTRVPNVICVTYWKSGLVHRLHPVSGGNRAGAFGSFVELPTSVYRFDRFPCGRCVFVGRGNCRR